MSQLATQTIREQLINHPIYKEMNHAARIRILMKHHVFAVWDFMSLLKKLQQAVTCVNVPWMPVKNANYARFVNEIVLGEETDEDGNGGYISHFELYQKAMHEVEADLGPIHRFLNRLQSGISPSYALQSEEIPESVAAFVNYTIQLAVNGKPHEVAAAFFFGREELIPDMFQRLVDEVENNGLNASGLKYYLHRHIELDGDDHGPLAKKLLDSLCDGDPIKIAEAEVTAQQSLQHRIHLWDGVLKEIQEKGL